MSSPQSKKALAAARVSLASPLHFDEVLARLSPKDRVNAEKRVSVLPEETAAVWRRLACTLMTLAPQAKFVGKQTVQFYVPDGKYRMQVFALEDLQDTFITVYCPDVVKEAADAGLLMQPPNADAHMYFIASSTEPLRVETLDGTSLNPGAHFKDMVGWNRKALRITLPPAPSPAQVEATELLCAFAAHHFVRTAAPATPGGPAKSSTSSGAR
jgi:hypothetical protein